MKTTFRFLAIALLVSSFIFSESTAQQLPQFSQYIFNGLHINPAYAGYKNEGYVQSTYRSQWVGFEGAPETFTLTADFSANEGMMGFGAIVLADRIGPTNTTSAMLSYAYRVQTGRESFLGLGASAGVAQYNINGDMLKALHDNDTEIPMGNVSMMTPNMNLGLFFHNSKFYAGVSAYNLIGKGSLEKEDIALAYHDIHFYLTAGALLDVSENIKFKPSFLVKQVKGSPTTYDLNGMMLFMDRLWLGASYRSNLNIMSENPEAGSLSKRNAVAFIGEIFATPNLRIGYAYDQNLNVLQDMRTNSHEISVGYYLSARKVTMKNPRWF
jgi:type IX secretion system PorP/SprF family membrane protein